LKNLTTAGCSFTLDNYQKTWADYLAQELDCKLTNLGARGAGIDFISKRIIYHCRQNSTDLMVVMLPSVDRFDWYIDQHHPLKTAGISISSWQNGLGPSLMTLDGQSTNTEGYSLSGGEIRGHKQHWFKYYYSEPSALLNYWTAVYHLENFFKIKRIPYYFTTAYDRDNLVEQAYNQTQNNNNLSWIFDCIDWSRFIFYQTDRGFLSYSKDQKFAIVNNHPVTEAHISWVSDVVLKQLVQQHPG
jgi:hypothetical protein